MFPCCLADIKPSPQEALPNAKNTVWSTSCKMPRVFCKSGPKSQKPNPVFPPHSRCVSFRFRVFFLSRSNIKLLTTFVKKKPNKTNPVLCCVAYRRVPTAQDLPPVGHAAAGQFLLPLLHWCGHTAAAEGPTPGQRLQRMHPAVLRPAR